MERAAQAGDQSERGNPNQQDGQRAGGGSWIGTRDAIHQLAGVQAGHGHEPEREHHQE